MSDGVKKQQSESNVRRGEILSDNKLCLSCNKVRNLSEFHSNKSKYDSLQAHCKRCVAIVKKKKYIKKRKEVRFKTELFGCLESEVIVSFSDVFSEAVLNLVDDGKL